MKHELYVVGLCAIFVLVMSFMIFDSNYSFTGLAVSEEASNADNSSYVELNFDNVLSSLNESLVILEEMKSNNFSVVYMYDQLIEAERILKQAQYAEVLRNPNSSSAQQAEARKYLNLVDWKKINYSSVLVYTEDIKNRRERAFQIYDLITVNQLSLDKYKLKGMNLSEAEQLLGDARIAFYEDRYEEAESILVQVRENIDSKSSEINILTELKNGLIGFLQKYWIYLIILAISLYVLIKYFLKKLEFENIKKKIIKLSAESKVLDELIIKTQTERYKENKISGLVYNIRIEKYKERQNKIKEELPVLENRLREHLKIGKTKFNRKKNGE